jgi:hypothetical protein
MSKFSENCLLNISLCMKHMGLSVLLETTYLPSVSIDRIIQGYALAFMASPRESTHSIMSRDLQSEFRVGESSSWSACSVCPVLLRHQFIGTPDWSLSFSLSNHLDNAASVLNFSVSCDLSLVVAQCKELSLVLQEYDCYFTENEYHTLNSILQTNVSVSKVW